jgi:hypothetical protein
MNVNRLKFGSTPTTSRFEDGREAPDMLGRTSHLRKRALEGGLSSRHLKTFYGLSETVSNFTGLFATNEASRKIYQN